VLETVRDGDWLRFAKVNFADGSADGSYNRRGRLGLTARLIPLAGGLVEVRIDEPYKGRKIGEFPMIGSGRPGQWVEVSTLLDTRPEDGAYGCHDLYLVSGGRGRDLFEADRFGSGTGICRKMIFPRQHAWDTIK
jgi:glucuronoarabinoxylan endo-1,4-beta-xylanase